MTRPQGIRPCPQRSRGVIAADGAAAIARVLRSRRLAGRGQKRCTAVSGGGLGSLIAVLDATAQLAQRQRMADAGAAFFGDRDVPELRAQLLLLGFGSQVALGRDREQMPPPPLAGTHTGALSAFTECSCRRLTRSRN
jgi:hypothetical protein